MKLFWLENKQAWRNISTVIQQIYWLKQLPNKKVELKINDIAKIYSNNTFNDQISQKINDILKTNISEGEIVTLLKTFNISDDNTFVFNWLNLFCNFENNILTISETKLEEIKKEEKKETKIKLSSKLEYDTLEWYKMNLVNDTKSTTEGDKVNDILWLLSKSVLFASANGIWDVVIKQEEYVYFIKWEDNIHDEHLDEIVTNIQNNKPFSWKELRFFFDQMTWLSAEKEEDENDRKEYKATLEKTLKDVWSVDFAVKVEWRKLRVNFSYSNGKKLGAVMRVIESWKPPLMEDLWLVWWKNGHAYRDVLSFPFWLILVVWPTWSWKSFSLTSMIWEINRTKYKHIITLEDPIEFEHENILSRIEQKEVWVDVVSYAAWLKWILRQKPHIVVCWEIRDAEVMEKALELAATWHVVFATFHANDVLSTIQRIMDFFPVEKQKAVLQQLSEFVLWIFVQKLVSRKGGWKVLIKEIMVQTENIKNAIMTNNMKTLVWYIEAGWKYWMRTNDQSIEMLFEDWLIDQKTAVDFAKDKPAIRRLTKYDEYANIW